MLEHDLLTFIRGAIRSVWALELLLLLKRTAPRAWTHEELVKELRASRTLAASNLEPLKAAGVIAYDEAGACAYAPASPLLSQMCDLLEHAYRERPLAVIDVIVASPNDRLQNFADAFRFKDANAKEKDE